MRRSATVTSSAPLASIAAGSASSERKPPVPSSRRELSSRPPTVKVSSVTASAGASPPRMAAAMSRATSASLDRAQDLDPRAVAELARGPLAARHHLGVDRHGHAALPRGELEGGEGGLHGRARLELGRLAV